MEATKPLIKYGWVRALIYFVIVFFLIILLQLSGTSLLKTLNLQGRENDLLNYLLLYTWMGAGLYLVTFLFRKFIDRRSLGSLGFSYKSFSDESALGFFIAVALLGIGSLILAGLGYITFLTISVAAYPLLTELLLMIVVAFLEEVLFRGYLLNNLMQSCNKWLALIISAVLFSLFHMGNPDVSWFALINIFIGGLFLGINYIYTKNLWFSIFFHFAWNFLQGPVLGYEVSGMKMESLFHQALTGPELWTGGRFGFEGSLLCTIILSLCIVVLVYGFKRKYEAAKSM